MKLFDKILSGLVMGTLAPSVMTLLFWWGSIPVFKTNDKLIMIFALSGLVLGLILNLTVLKRLIFRLYSLGLKSLIFIVIYYSVMVYGFFMGFPVFNLIVGVTAVYIASKRAVYQNEPKEAAIKNTKAMTLAAFFILLFLCICSALLALNESSIRSQVKGMFNLPFDVSMGMIWVFIIVGGALLLFLQQLLSRIVSDCVLKNTEA